ncbi:hypothetical protein [Antarcticirhabdus aurantiaca]|uniref:Uncharacterized protein n=1 Tax=Antarcticirhabdus aurantiaca TaxID=2606717 RepID=A0ACD4NJB5_9HYPH|nr:hypothetical protein OXU80_18535 [Jeongeuplla avenae]
MPAITPVRLLPANTTAAVLYTVPAGQQAVVNVNACAQAACKVNIGVGTASNPAAADWMEFEFPLSKGGGALERTQITLPAGSRIYVKSDTASACAFQLTGMQEEAV